MHKRFDWTVQALALLGAMSDRDAGKQLGIHSATVGKKRREMTIAKYDSYKGLPIGKVPDATIAKMKGVSITSVALRRYREGIKALQKQEKWTEEHVALLGTASDKEVGKMVGRKKMAVYTARRTRGIPAYQES